MLPGIIRKCSLHQTWPLDPTASSSELSAALSHKSAWFQHGYGYSYSVPVNQSKQISWAVGTLRFTYRSWLILSPFISWYHDFNQLSYKLIQVYWKVKGNQQSSCNLIMRGVWNPKLTTPIMVGQNAGFCASRGFSFLKNGLIWQSQQL